MKNITVIPLEQWMIDTIRFNHQDEEIKRHLVGIIRRNDARLFGALSDERLVGIGGVWKFGYIFGEWGIWLTEEVKKRPFWLVKNCLKFINITCIEMDIRYVIALAEIKKPESGRLLKCLGFNLKNNIPIVADEIKCHVYEKVVVI